VSLRTADYDYPLPEELIARHPAERRDASRMMVLHRAEQRIEHRMFADFPNFLRDGDLVVLSDTRVIPARAFSDDGKIELLFLEPAEVAASVSERKSWSVSERKSSGGPSSYPLAHARSYTAWKCLVRPGKKLRANSVVTLG